VGYYILVRLVWGMCVFCSGVVITLASRNYKGTPRWLYLVAFVGVGHVGPVHLEKDMANKPVLTVENCVNLLIDTEYVLTGNDYNNVVRIIQEGFPGSKPPNPMVWKVIRSYEKLADMYSYEY
jgi:hypothetical protein